MKKLLYFLFALIAIPINTIAYDFEQNGIYYNILSTTEKTVEVTFGANKYSEDITINSNVEFENITFTVTGVGKGAFGHCQGLTSVKLPQTIRSIGESAFSGSENLTSVEIPSTVTYIGQLAFHFCRNLKSATIPSGVTELYPCTFAYCSNLEGVTLPKNIKKIGLECFQYCEKLPGIILPDSLQHIGDYAFEWCDRLKSIAIPEEVSLIGSSAFLGCKNLETLELRCYATICKEAFRHCNDITSISVYQERPIDFNDDAFPGIVKLKAVLYVPVGAKSAYEESASWGQFTNIVEMGSTDIQDARADKSNGKVYTLGGVELPANGKAKGIVIQGGRKTIRR